VAGLVTSAGSTPTTPFFRAQAHAQAHASDVVEAQLHDVYQKPSHFGVDADEVDAQQRVARWGGPGEWQAAMLALSGPAWSNQAWQSMTTDLLVAPAVREEMAKLGPAAQRWAREHFLQQAREHTVAARLRLVRPWLRRLRQQPSNAALLLCQLATRHTLAPSRPMPRGSGTVWIAASVHAATQAFARTLPLPAHQQQQWRQAAEQALADMGFASPVRTVERGLAPRSEVALFAALRVRRLSAMQKPLLIKAWMAAAAAIGQPVSSHDGLADALHWACLGLGLPPPATVAVAAAPVAVSRRA
jgi:hypothetical protein